MAPSFITSRQIEGEKLETVTDYFLVLQITADGDWSHDTKRRLLLGRKAMTNRDITFVCIVKATVFPGVMYGCKSWTKRRLSTKELMLSNCGDGEHSLKGGETCKEIKPVISSAS